MNSETLFQQASELIRENASVHNSDEAWNIARALQILVDANQLESATTPLKIKIIKAMASCNYKIGNLDFAYNCAIIAKEKINEYIENGSPSDDEYTRAFLKENECDEIIEAVRRNGKGQTLLLEDYVLETVETYYIKKLFAPKNECLYTRDELYNLIHTIEQTKNAIIAQAMSYNDYQIAQRVEAIFNMYKYPLYYIWQKYLFGNDEEVWVEGENMMPYHIFISNIKERTNELLLLLKNSNPFAPLTNGATITQSLYKILGDLQKRLSEGKI